MPRHTRTNAALLALALLWPAAGSAAQQDNSEGGDSDPPPPQAPATLIARELLVLQTDHYGKNANDADLIDSTLGYPFKTWDRVKLPENADAMDTTPMPLGLITFEGRINQPVAARLELTSQDAFVHAFWPSTAIKGTRFIEWYPMAQAGNSQSAQAFNSPRHWLRPLRRSADRAWLQLPAPRAVEKENFLLYDVSLPFASGLTLQDADDKGYRLSATDPSGQQDDPPITLLIRKTAGGWSSFASQPPWPEQGVAIAGEQLRSEPGRPLAQSLEPLTGELAERGYNQAERDIAVGMIGSAGLSDTQMALVYILPDGAIDPHIALELTPEPDELIRSAIVVVTNVDPGLGKDIDRLIIDLASEDWPTRDKAHKQLLKLGQVAYEKLSAELDNPDPEVAFRARQIVEALRYRTKARR